ncbi:hypothetical protein CONPUDRAFT_79528 [Coniophora puteana RWD-64-598 SS2]|uniref:Uncharacterized protein n=1 Tax=Coniophora puteana (strain RWD-64-598) TaxID=741705 RepID=A0A5M3MZW6_CONPW|nr:uncharacterized protein CONPUDRAFT_79528 [Coniophora puteana RWD-64-598 SS2]EIW84703.1 hypothetical protein CONPUDRAFT_79528 [Coniophora puteana RWD-64-598 SS2]
MPRSASISYDDDIATSTPVSLIVAVAQHLPLNLNNHSTTILISQSHKRSLP